MLIVWFGMSYYFQSSMQKAASVSNIVNSVDEEIDYKYAAISKTELLNKINKQFSVDAYKAQIERHKNLVRGEYNNADLVERITLERELTLLQIRIENNQQFYNAKVNVLLEAFQALAKFRSEFSANEYNSAQSALLQGDTELADRLFSKVDEKYRVTLGGDGIDRAAEAVHQKGKIAEDQIDYRKAYQYYRQAVRYDPLNIKYLVDAAKIADSIALYSKAIIFYEAALGILQSNKGASADEIRQFLINLGKTWSSKGELDKALEYYELALANDIDTFGRIHLNVAEDHNYLGSAWESKGNTQKAKQHFHNAVKLYEITLGKTHQSTLSARENLARVM